MGYKRKYHASAPATGRPVPYRMRSVIDHAKLPRESRGLLGRLHLPRLSDIPIPPNIRPDESWPPSLVEVADHVGAYNALLLVERFGGDRFRVASDYKLSPLFAIWPPSVVEHFHFNFAHELFWVPTAKTALNRARRGAVLAAVRAGTLTGNDAAVILETSRRQVGTMLHYYGEGLDSAPIALPEPALRALARDAAAVAAAAMHEAGVPEAATFDAVAEILKLTDLVACPDDLDGFLPNSEPLVENDGA